MTADFDPPPPAYRYPQPSKVVVTYIQISAYYIKLPPQMSYKMKQNSSSSNSCQKLAKERS
jgi:hypothetical protein